MLTLDVKFHCDSCGAALSRTIRVGPNFFLGADNLPEGWVIRSEEHRVRCWCPQHVGDAK